MSATATQPPHSPPPVSGPNGSHGPPDLDAFEHHWQDFRTRKDRSLKTRTDTGWNYAEKGKHQICVKVIDVFGVDTTTVIEVRI